MSKQLEYRRMKKNNVKRNIFAVLLVIVGCTFAILYEKSRHDLSGIYYTYVFFPVTSITFSNDGTFVACNEIDTLHGKYSKRGSVYSLQFVDGKSKSGNPVSNYEAASADSQYELKAEKISDGCLRIYVIPKIGYWAWYRKYADFYTDGL